jgi:hypothetical protein
LTGMGMSRWVFLQQEASTDKHISSPTHGCSAWLFGQGLEAAKTEVEKQLHLATAHGHSACFVHECVRKRGSRRRRRGHSSEAVRRRQGGDCKSCRHPASSSPPPSASPLWQNRGGRAETGGAPLFILVSERVSKQDDGRNKEKRGTGVDRQTWAQSAGEREVLVVASTCLGMRALLLFEGWE